MCLNLFDVPEIAMKRNDGFPLSPLTWEGDLFCLQSLPSIIIMIITKLDIKIRLNTAGTGDISATEG